MLLDVELDLAFSVRQRWPGVEVRDGYGVVVRRPGWRPSFPRRHPLSAAVLRGCPLDRDLENGTQTNSIRKLQLHLAAMMGKFGYLLYFRDHSMFLVSSLVVAERGTRQEYTFQEYTFQGQ